MPAERSVSSTEQDSTQEQDALSAPTCDFLACFPVAGTSAGDQAWYTESVLDKEDL